MTTPKLPTTEFAFKFPISIVGKRCDCHVLYWHPSDLMPTCSADRIFAGYVCPLTSEWWDAYYDED